MAEEVNVKMSVESGQARAEIKRVKNDLDDLNGTAKDSAKSMGKLKTAEEGVEEGVKKIGSATGDFGKVGVFTFRAVTTAIKAARQGTKAFKAALISIGVGAAMLALDFIIANWSKIEALITGSTEALEKYEAAQVRLTHETVKFNYENSLLNKKMFRAQKQFDDQNATLQERIDALAELTDLEYERLENELDLLQVEKETLEQKELAGEFEKADAERLHQIHLREEAIKLEFLKLDHKQEQQQEKLIAQDEALRKAAEEKAKAEKDAKKAIEDRLEAERKARFEAAEQAQKEAQEARKNEFLDELGEIMDAQAERTMTAEEVEIRRLRDKYNRLLNEAAMFGEDTLALEEERQFELDKIAEKHEKIRTKIADIEANTRKKAEEQILNDIIAIVGQETAAGKAMSIAQATINSYVAFTSALANPAKLPPPIPQLQAVAALTSGLAQVKRIVATKIPNQFGGAGMSMGGMSSTLPSVSVIGSNLANESMQYGFGKMADAKPVLKTYVVSGDVSGAQALDRRIERNATFAG